MLVVCLGAMKSIPEHSLQQKVHWHLLHRAYKFLQERSWNLLVDTFVPASSIIPVQCCIRDTRGGIVREITYIVKCIHAVHITSSIMQLVIVCAINVAARESDSISANRANLFRFVRFSIAFHFSLTYTYPRTMWHTVSGMEFLLDASRARYASERSHTPSMEAYAIVAHMRVNYYDFFFQN